MKSASVYRRTNKPLMEKKRRARINESLLQLKTLVLDTMKSDPMQYSKLEKADILELTVAHLVRQQRHLAAEGSDSISKYAIGFNECANEVVRYLSEDNLGVRPEVRSRVLNHLAKCINTSRYMKRLDNLSVNVQTEALENVSVYHEDQNCTTSYEATQPETDCISNKASPGLANQASPEHFYIPETRGIPGQEFVGYHNNDLNFGPPSVNASTMSSSSSPISFAARQSPSIPNEDYVVPVREDSYSNQNIQRQKRSPMKYTERQTLSRNEMSKVPQDSQFSSIRHTYQTGHLPSFKKPRHENTEARLSTCEYSFQRTENNGQNTNSCYHSDGRMPTPPSSSQGRLSPPEIFPYSRNDTTAYSENSLKLNDSFGSHCNIPTSAPPSQSSFGKQRPPLGALKTVESASLSRSRQRVSYSRDEGQEQRSDMNSFGDVSFGILNFKSSGVWRPW